MKSISQSPLDNAFSAIIGLVVGTLTCLTVLLGALALSTAKMPDLDPYEDPGHAK